MADISQADLDALFASMPAEPSTTSEEAPAQAPEITPRPRRPPAQDLSVSRFVNMMGVSTVEQVKELQSRIIALETAIQAEKATIEMLRLEIENAKSNLILDKILMQIVEIKQELRKRPSS